MTQVTLTMNINADELRNIRNTLTELNLHDLNSSQYEAIEGLLTLTDTIKDAIDAPTVDIGSDSVCPVCHGEDIQGGHVDIESGEAFQECTCSCGATWNNTYKYVGSSEIKEG